MSHLVHTELKERDYLMVGIPGGFSGTIRTTTILSMGDNTLRNSEVN